jgi:hypothetical protein
MEEAQGTLTTFINKIGEQSEKYEEYVQVYIIMSNIAESLNTPGAKTPLEWLNDAVDYKPDSVEARATRARFHRQSADTPGTSEENKQELLGLARKDLEKADEPGTENPRIRLFLGIEWVTLSELDRAADELKAAEALSQEALEEQFFLNDWI